MFNAENIVSDFANPLSSMELRILGVLIEKELATPEYYPLTLVSLQAGANQKSNRNPVTNYSKQELLQGLKALQERRLVAKVIRVQGGRVERFSHLLDERWELLPAHRAILSELLLRGQQTAGELRQRSERMVSISKEEFENILESLLNAEPSFCRILPKSPGQKEARIMHMIPRSDQVESNEENFIPDMSSEHADQPEPSLAPVTWGEFESFLESLEDIKAALVELEKKVNRLYTELGLEP